MRNQSRAASLIALANVVAGCSSITETRMPERPNPRVWTFSRPFEAVAQCLKEPVLVADAWGGVVDEQAYLENQRAWDVPGERLALTLKSMAFGAGSVHSEMYLRRSCPLGIYGQWRVKAVALSAAETRVEVTPIRLHVHNYDCSYFGHPWGCAIAVESSSIEEYRILMSIGRCLKVQGMPNPIRPAGDVPDPKSCPDPF